MRKLMFGAVAAAALGAAVTTAQAAPAAASVDGFTASVPAEYSQYRRYGRPYYRRGYGRGYGYGYGGGAAAGIAGLAAGALIAGAIANSAQAAPPPPATVDGRLADWCARRYRTFDPVTGTFMAQSGERLVCTYP